MAFFYRFFCFYRSKQKGRRSLQINIAYVAVSSFYSIIWAEPFREEEVLDQRLCHRL